MGWWCVAGEIKNKANSAQFGLNWNLAESFALSQNMYVLGLFLLGGLGSRKEKRHCTVLIFMNNPLLLSSIFPAAKTKPTPTVALFLPVKVLSHGLRGQGASLR